MIFSKEELSFIGNNKVYIKSILDKKYQDIVDELLIEKDATKSEVLKLWARECKELSVTLERGFKGAINKEPPHSGI